MSLSVEEIRQKTETNLESIRRKLSLLVEKLRDSGFGTETDRGLLNRKMVGISFALLKGKYSSEEKPEGSITGDLYLDILETCLAFHARWPEIDSRQDGILKTICENYTENFDQSIKEIAQKVLSSPDQWDSSTKETIFKGISAMVQLSLKYAYIKCKPIAVDTTGEYPVYTFEENLYPDVNISAEIYQRKIPGIPDPSSI